MSPEFAPLAEQFDEMRSCLSHGSFHAALHLALSIPDVCSSLPLSDENRFRVEPRYKAWCEKYLEPQYHHFDASDCWALRGGVIHNGMTGSHPKSDYARVAFLTSSTFATVSECVSENNGATNERVLLMDLGLFIERMFSAAVAWFNDHQVDQAVLDDLARLVRFRPQGLPPHHDGAPLIA